MHKSLRLLSSMSIMIAFIMLGVYILRTSDKLIGQIIGWANIIFFSGFIIWVIIKLLKSKINN